MQIYNFKAINDKGQKINGALTAENREQALQNLKLRYLYPISLRSQKLKQRRSNAWTIEWAKDVSFFLQSGLSLVEGLKASKLRLHKTQKQLIDLTIEGLHNGAQLSQILGEFGIFPQIFLGLLQVAEATGQYAQAFEDYAILKEEEVQFFKQLRTSLQYPLILVLVILGMLIGFSEFLLPTALQFFQQNNLEQQLVTQIFIKFSTSTKTFLSLLTDWQFLLIFALTTYVTIRIPYTRYYLGLCAIRIPFFGKIYLQTIQSIYLKSFSTMIARGHDVLLAAKYSRDILQNSFLKKQATNIEKSIHQEGKISVSIAKFLWLPDTLSKLLLTGEETAQLSTYCDICAKALKNQSRLKLQVILAWTGPLLVFIMGIVMIWMVIAIVVPLYDQISRIN